MTGDERSIRPVPGKVPESRKPKTSCEPARGRSPRDRRHAQAFVQDRLRLPAREVRRGSRARCCLGLACPGECCAQRERDQVEKFPEGTIVKIEYEGTSIPAEKIKPKLLSRVGQALSHEKAEADLKTLLGTKWFSDANLLGRRDAAQER